MKVHIKLLIVSFFALFTGCSSPIPPNEEVLQKSVSDSLKMGLSLKSFVVGEVEEVDTKPRTYVSVSGTVELIDSWYKELEEAYGQTLIERIAEAGKEVPFKASVWFNHIDGVPSVLSVKSFELYPLKESGGLSTHKLHYFYTGTNSQGKKYLLSQWGVTHLAGTPEGEIFAELLKKKEETNSKYLDAYYNNLRESRFSEALKMLERKQIIPDRQIANNSLADTLRGKNGRFGLTATQGTVDILEYILKNNLLPSNGYFVVDASTQYKYSSVGGWQSLGLNAMLCFPNLPKNLYQKIVTKLRTEVADVNLPVILERNDYPYQKALVPVVMYCRERGASSKEINQLTQLGASINGTVKGKYWHSFSGGNALRPRAFDGVRFNNGASTGVHP